MEPIAAMIAIVWTALSFNGHTIAYVLMVLISPVALFLRAAIDKSEVLRIDDGGILDRREKHGMIAWEHIGAVHRHEMHSSYTSTPRRRTA